ncbi:MAG: hypothetical protein IKZ60_08650 [Bacteroidales bacterium]|nr:hypothetical protein [Bacteroidales bacterium]
MKIFKLFTVVAIASALLVSCNKNNTDKPKQEPVPYEAPAYADVAATVTFEDDAVVTKGGAVVKSIEFTEAGYAIIIKEAVKSDDGSNVVVTTYTFEQGVYKILGFGNVEIKSGKATITAVADNDNAPSTEGQVNATVTTGSTTGADKSYFCAWEIMTTNIKVDGPGIGFDKLFKDPAVASDLEAIANYVNEKKKVIDADEFKGYKIESVSITQEGSILVKFANGVNYYGDFKLTSKTFTYELDIEGNFMFSAKANGKIDFNEETNILTLVVNGTFKYNSDTYTSAVTLTFKQKADIQ